MRKRNWPVWKKIAFIFTLILVFIRILYIIGRGELNKQYNISMEYDFTEFTELPCRNIEISFVGRGSRLDSLELIFTNIAEDVETDLTLGVQKDGRTLYQTGISLTADDNWKWKKIYLGMNPETEEEYILSLDVDDACEQVPMLLIVPQGAEEIMRSCQDGSVIKGTAAVNFGYLIAPGYLDRAITASLWLIFAAAVFLFLSYFEKVAGAAAGLYIRLAREVPPKVLNVVLEVLAGIIIVKCSGIELQESTKVILYGISLLATLKADEKRKCVRELADRPVKKVFLYLLYVYAAFALIGQRIWTYPLDVRIRASGVFVFAVAIFWFVPVIDSLLYSLETAGKAVLGDGGKRCRFVLICTGLLLLPTCYNLFANNPGISSPDTATCMIDNAKHLHGMYGWHPLFYCMILKVIQKVSDTTYAVIAAQYFFWAYVANELLLYLRKRGVRGGILIGAAGFMGFNAANVIHLNTIWKDIPYTLSLLWVFVILAKLALDYEEYRRKWYIYLEFAAAMTGVCLYRQNGIVTFLIVAVTVLVVFRKSIKIWMSVVAVTVLIFVIKGPVYDYYDVVDPGEAGIYIGLGQDVLGVYYAGGEVSEDTLAMITQMTVADNDRYRNSYTPTWSYASYYVDVTPPEFISCYIDTFLKNPILMIRAVIDREDALWDIFQGKDAVLGCVNYIGTEDADVRYQWNDYYPARHYISLFTDMEAATSYTANTQWIAAIEWRSGLLMLLGLTTWLFIILKKGGNKYMVLLAPMAGHILSLLLSTGWSDFRYFWPMNLLNMAWIMIALAMIEQCSKTEKDNEKDEIVNIKHSMDL